MATLSTYVTVHRAEDGTAHTFGPGDDLPSWAEKAITNPDVWDGKPPAHIQAGEPDDAAKAPARNAPKAEWVDHAVAQGAVREDAEASTKEDLVAKYGG